MLITKHAFQRLKERVNENIDSDQAVNLATKAFHQGKTAAHFLEIDPMLADYLSYKQSKYEHKTLRLLDGMIYIYDLSQQVLITCYPSDLEDWKKRNKKIIKKYLHKK